MLNISFMAIKANRVAFNAATIGRAGKATSQCLERHGMLDDGSAVLTLGQRRNR